MNKATITTPIVEQESDTQAFLIGDVTDLTLGDPKKKGRESKRFLYA